MLGVDEVAAAVFEETGEEVEVLEGFAVRGGFAIGAEGGLEVVVAVDAAVGEGSFLAEEEAAHDFFGVAFGDDFCGADEVVGFWFC